MCYLLIGITEGYIKESGNYCHPGVETNWTSKVDAEKKCRLNADCSMFWKGCDDTYLYCNSDGHIKSSDCTTLYIAGKCNETVY